MYPSNQQFSQGFQNQGQFGVPPQQGIGMRWVSKGGCGPQGVVMGQYMGGANQLVLYRHRHK